MLAILSPAKDMKLSFVEEYVHTNPAFLSDSSKLVKELKTFKVNELSALMKISPKLAQLNVDRYKLWSRTHNADSAGQAMFSFTGEAYRGLEATSMSDQAIKLATKNFRILSGLYGVLNPLDLIHEHRLEMGTKLKVGTSKNLYEFWGDKITKAINKAILESEGEKVLVNVASNEYSKSINFKKLKYPVITPIFKNEVNGQLKVVAVYAKKARGMMTRFLLENNISTAEDMKAFNAEGYYFNSELSTETDWVFSR